ncbi:MAG: UDP-N-acetylmuramyl-tripeptide synthetase, partial [Acidimicrobiales bacterium]|nr:UDP-N-acetylmuramyl-tripeptide synthetase [Acidimicrobiales bacterium]
MDGRDDGSGLSASGLPVTGGPSIPLARLASVVEGAHVVGDPADVVIRGVTFHTGQVRKDVLHCCLPGASVDGHDLAGEAVAAGAAALLCERPLPVEAVQIVVAPGRARAAMAQLAAAYWGYPARSLQMVGVTGTNGKTTVVHLLRAILSAHGWPTVALGTLDGPRTTPEAPLLQAELARQVRDQTKAVAMEVTSHALVQHRVDGIRFGCAVFTNLSQDHLDFHHTMESYYEAKASLFSAERAEVGVAGADDPFGRRLLDEAPIPMEPFSLSEAAGVELGPFGSRFRWRGHPIHLHLHGCFNVANALAAAHAACRLGVPEATVAAGLSALAGVPGRYEGVDEGQPFRVVVDYAHTPAALAAVLGAARVDAARPWSATPHGGRQDPGPEGRVIVVFGCGGDRDRSKRPVMGEVATRL